MLILVYGSFRANLASASTRSFLWIPIRLGGFYDSWWRWELYVMCDVASRACTGYQMPDWLSWVGLVCWSLTSLCHSNGHIETMPAREINPFTALTRIRPQFLRTQWSTSNHQRVDTTTPQTAEPSGLAGCHGETWARVVCSRRHVLRGSDLIGHRSVGAPDEVASCLARGVVLGMLTRTDVFWDMRKVNVNLPAWMDFVTPWWNWKVIIEDRTWISDV